MEGLPRRRFMQQLLGTAAAAAVLPRHVWGDPAASLENAARHMPVEDAGDEAFWHLVKKQFMLREGLIMLNAANLCPSPWV